MIRREEERRKERTEGRRNKEITGCSEGGKNDMRDDERQERREGGVEGGRNK